MKKYLCQLAIISLFLSACTSKEVKHTSIGETSKEVVTPVNLDKINTRNDVESIDEAALRRSLGLEFPKEHLGYAEKKFNTCNVGYGYSKVNNCRDLYFIVIHFQMLCRDSEGTVSEVIQSDDLIRNSGRNLRWDMKEHRGTTMTDGFGYSQIRLITTKSQRQQRFKLILQNDFLYLQAGEVDRIITPRPWCRG